MELLVHILRKIKRKFKVKQRNITDNCGKSGTIKEYRGKSGKQFFTS